ncbi:uncharacterized protein [Musca autumnalis]|uniref:uncharacterized protein n=1 Tax=Musca autumnalis TaxID=221902 RepID=UPI003CE96CDB
MNFFIATLIGLMTLLALSQAKSTDESGHSVLRRGRPSDLATYHDNENRDDQPVPQEDQNRGDVVLPRVHVLFDFGSNNYFGTGNFFGDDRKRPTTTPTTTTEWY